MLDAFFGVDGLPHERQRAESRDALDAMDHPEKYPHLTIRVSGYAVNFVRLTREQQMDVINRTFHGVVAMQKSDTLQQVRAAGEKTRFELRVGLGRNVPESGVRSALATGDMGFLHSFTTGPLWMAPVFVSSHGQRAACFAACTVTTRIRGT
jgi:hypothetical protein